MPKASPSKTSPTETTRSTARTARPARIVSWNVNGIRAIHKNGFGAWLDSEMAAGTAFVGLQEVRARAEEVPDDVRARAGWHTGVVAASRKGYSGVAFYSAVAPTRVVTSLGEARFDDEGRYVEVGLPNDVTIVSAYFPNGNGTVLPGGKRSNDRIPYKLDFYRAVFDRLQPRLLAGEKVVVMGDFNTAHAETDLARPKDNRETSGFTDIERAELDRWVAAGWVDSFRAMSPDAVGAYSWWSQRFGVRARNVGWRIDMAMVSSAVVPMMTGAFIDAHVMGSDHCPIGIEVDAEAFFGADVLAPATPKKPRARATGAVAKDGVL
jgi:exodeoxyribonuclease-3